MNHWLESIPWERVIEGLNDFGSDWYEFIEKNKVVLVITSAAVLYGIFIRKSTTFTKEDFKIRLAIRADRPYEGEELELLEIDAPVISTWLRCKISRWMSNTPLRSIMKYKLTRSLRRDALENIIYPEGPTFLPLVKGDASLYERSPVTENDLWKYCGNDSGTENKDKFQFVSISYLLQLYREGIRTPESVMRTLISHLKEDKICSPPIRCYIEYYEEKIMEQAYASTKRWSAGNPLSVFDGVPVGVKEEYIVADHHAYKGLPFDMDGDKKFKLSDEGGLIKKLRQGGAILIGMTNMHQIGLGITGINQSERNGTARNPYNNEYPAGGSSSGSASAVASGLAVVGIGGDGGGSIRIPAAFCGIVGLKATFGAYTNTGKKINSYTVGHTGALCSSVRDMAITYGFLAGKDEEFPEGLIQPPIFLGDFHDLNLKGLKVGVDRTWLARACSEMQDGVEQALRWLREHYHVEIIDIHVPEKFELSLAHITIIISEMLNKSKILNDVYHDVINIDTKGLLQTAADISAHQYLQSSIQRTRSINALKYIFTKVDVVLTPGAGDFMPKLKPSMEKYGFLDVALTTRVMEPHQLLNLTGAPGITLPVGYTAENLPVAIQLVSSWWREDLLFKVAYAIEHCVKHKAPRVFYNITS